MPPTTVGQLETRPGRLSRIGASFSVFQDRNFLSYWLGSFCYYAGLSMEQLVRAWLALEMTGSAAKLGVAVVSQGVPSAIISIVGGTLADRIPKKVLLLIAQAMLAGTSGILFLLVITDAIQFWHLVFFGIFNGCATGISLPSRLSFVSEVVPEADFQQAYGLYYAALNLTRIGAPAISGFLLGISGAAAAYAIISGVQTLSLVFLVFVRPLAPMLSRAGISFVRDMVSTFDLLKENSTILILMGANLGITFFVFSSIQMMPVFVSRVYELGPEGLGQFQAAIGVGGLMGSLAVTLFARVERKALLLLAVGGLQGVVLILFSSLSIFVLGLVVLIAIGICSAMYTTINSTLFQTASPPHMRGRATSLYMLGFALQPLGVLPISAAADSVGVQAVVAVAGALLIVYVAVLAAGFPSFREMRVKSAGQSSEQT